ncbi:2-hydroxyacid dehydrogenase [Lasius niger]|uniref:2-hydroxyacid dehydrogenase n=1 Tax=Lasius niger TaxID=67767 RepID=A0A0J7KHC0_LASNI|nr:2-hydroxyacid dehydrogenase [Lasius niger]
MRPAIVGIRKPMIETRYPKNRLDILLEEMDKQREEIRAMKRFGPRWKAEWNPTQGDSTKRFIVPCTPWALKKGTGIRVTGNVQLVPPKSGSTGMEKQRDKWSEIGKGGKIKKILEEN